MNYKYDYDNNNNMRYDVRIVSAGCSRHCPCCTASRVQHGQADRDILMCFFWFY